MKLWDNMIRKAGLVRLGDVRRMMKRAYAVASQNRLTADWLTSSTTMDADIQGGLSTVRARARELSQNDAYAKRYLSLVRMNVPGPQGFTLQVKAVDYESRRNESTGRNEMVAVEDKFANDMIEREFYRWARREFCTVTGALSFRDVQHLIIETVARDGEILVRKVEVPFSQNPYGFTLQLIEPDMLDHEKNEALGNGNVIRLGVEFNAWRRPVAYHIRKSDPRSELLSDTYETTGTTVRIPAKEIYHLYRPERAFQSRGISWMVQGMWALKMLTGWEEAALVNARASAAQMGFLKNRENSAGPVPHDEQDSDGNMIQNTEPGLLIDIGDKDLVKYDPHYPQEQHGAFVKAILRRFASGTGTSYNLLGNDLEGVNYSSIRAGLLDEREQWKDIQSWIIESFLEPLFADWLVMFLLSPRTTLPMAKFEKFNAPVWIGRRWPWVDPKNDVEAAILAVQAGLKSARRIMAEEGTDLTETYQEITADKEMAEDLGLSFSVYAGGQKQAEPPAPRPNEDGEEENDEEEDGEDMRFLRKKRNGHNTPV